MLHTRLLGLGVSYWVSASLDFGTLQVARGAGSGAEWKYLSVGLVGAISVQVRCNLNVERG